MNVIFRVGHESEHVALRVADARDIENGAIWVNGVIAVRRRTVRVDVGESDLVVGDERRKRKRFGYLKIAFTVCDGTGDGVFQAFCPNAGLRDRRQVHPATFKMSLFVECECRTFFFLSSFIFLFPWQNPRLNQRLKPIANPDHWLA